jgi:hypothetical protein
MPGVILMVGFRADRKAQGAMEYLMTYGWAILVVIIVGIVLFQSGVFGTQTQGISGFAQIRVKDFQLLGSSLTVVFTNTVGQTIRQVNITFFGNCVPTNATVTPTPTTWAPGREYAVTVTCASFTCTQSAAYKNDLAVQFVTESNLFHNDTGTIRGICG